METDQDIPGIFEGAYISGEETRDYAKQLGDQVLKAHPDLLEALNRGNIKEVDLPRVIRMILKDNWFTAGNKTESPLMSMPRRHQEVLLWIHARNGLEGKRVDSYLNSVSGFMMSTARAIRKRAGEVAGKLAGE